MLTMKISNTVFKNLSLYFVSSIITSIVGILINPILASKLSHMDYAIIGYYASFATLLTPIVSISLQSYYARNYYRVDEKMRNRMYNTIMSISFVLGFIFLVLFILVYYLYHTLYVSSIPFSPYAVLSFFPIYLTSFYNLYLMDLRMSNKALKYATVTILNSFLLALLSILLVYCIEWGAVGRLLAILANALLFLVYVVHTRHVKICFDISIVKESLSFSWPLVISGILSFFFIGIDRAMLEKIHDNYNLGLYNVGLQISTYLAIFGTVLLQTFDPDLYKFTSTNQHKKVVLTALGIVLLTLIPNMFFIVISEPLIDFLTAGRYVDAAEYSNILCIKNVMMTFAFVMSGILIGYGHSKYELGNRILGSVIAIITYYILIGNYGFYGAAWGQSITWLFMGIISLLCLIFIRKKNDKIKCNCTCL